MKPERVWPYVLPFPIEAKQRRLVWSVLQSRVGMSILMKLRLDRRTYQQELIKQTPYSNKSIIEYLKRMILAGLLDHGMEPHKIEKKRRIWVKWYMPTQLGRWFILFLKQPGEIPADTARKTIEELFQLYSSSIVEVCEKYGLSVDSFHHILNQHHIKEVIEKAPKIKPKVAVYGSAALDIYGTIEKLPAPEETVYVEERGRYPGGMGANVAVALARLDVSVAFVGKLGNDTQGRLLLESLCKDNVDVSHLTMADLTSLQTLILSDKAGNRWLFTLGSPNTAISLASPNEVDWKPIRESRVIYIGEVFLEVAPAIASFAKKRRKMVVYRPGIPYLRLGIEKLCEVLKHVDIFILNQLGWEILQDISEAKLETPISLLQYGPATIIITKGAEGCDVYTLKEQFEVAVPAPLKERFKIVDPTGAGDSFSAGLIKGLLQRWDLKKAISYGQVAAAITCSCLGATPAFPTALEVEKVFKIIK